jgi:glycosyltransferase involved in cell wall biosynthesis
MVELSVVVPIYNEAGELWQMATDLAERLDRIVGSGAWQFVLVDNGSADASPQIIDRIVKTWPTSIARHLAKPDYGMALADGLTRAEGDWAYLVNVDFWDEAFLNWCWRYRGPYDLVLGSKRADASLNQQQSYRRLLSWGLNTILQSVFGFVGTDTHGQKFLSLASMRPILAETRMRRGQYDTEFSLRAMRTGLWIAEVPVPLVELRPPRNLMLGKIFRNLVDIVRLRRIMRLIPANRPVRYHRFARHDVECEDNTHARFLLALTQRSSARLDTAARENAAS